MLTLEGCRKRLERLLAAMEANELDFAMITHPLHVYYFTGWMRGGINPLSEPCALCVWANGRSVLVAGGEEIPTAADEMRPYETYSLDRVITDATRDAAEALAAELIKEAVRQEIGAHRVGIEEGTLPYALYDVMTTCCADALVEDITPMIGEMRAVKDPDEIALIEESIAIAEAAYTVARDAVRPGATEIDVYAALAEAAFQRAGTSITLDGAFACGVRASGSGGPPTPREIQPGELYILDLFPAWHGYRADLCRTFAVDSVTDEQLRTWEVVRGALETGAALVKPGVGARDVDDAIRAYLLENHPHGDSFIQHAGHGVGLWLHDSPRIIPGSTHTFRENMIFALEPGLYHESLGGGVRLEQVYRVTETGTETLSHFPLNL